MSAGPEETYEAWLATRPAQVQALAAEFPPDLALTIKGRRYIVIGWTEGDELIMADPTLSYEDAVKHRRILHAQHVRDGEVT